MKLDRITRVSITKLNVNVWGIPIVKASFNEQKGDIYVRGYNCRLILDMIQIFQFPTFDGISYFSFSTILQYSFVRDIVSPRYSQHFPINISKASNFLHIQSVNVQTSAPYKNMKKI